MLALLGSPTSIRNSMPIWAWQIHEMSKRPVKRTLPRIQCDVQYMPIFYGLFWGTIKANPDLIVFVPDF